VFQGLFYCQGQNGKLILGVYAHPLFWAPFIIVGEGGGAQETVGKP
jgi:hypothetical protein